MAAALTQRQKEVLKYIEVRAKNGESPTFKEIADELKISQKAARDHVNAMVNKGYLNRTSYKSRSITLMPRDPEVRRSPQLQQLAYLPPVLEANRDIVEIPIYRRISPVEPYLKSKDLQGILPLPSTWVEYYTEDCFAFPFKYETMLGAGILPGDLIIARHVEQPRDGDIVMVNVKKKNVLRRMFFNGDRVILMAENPVLQPQTFSIHEVHVIAQYLGIWRTFMDAP